MAGKASTTANGVIHTLSLMTGKLQSLEVDGVPVSGVLGRFSNQFTIADRFAYYMPFDQEVILVVKARVGPPSTKERKSGVLRVNNLKVVDMSLAPGSRADELEAEFFRDLPPEDSGSTQPPQRRLDRVVKRDLEVSPLADGEATTDGEEGERGEPTVGPRTDPAPPPSDPPEEAEGSYYEVDEEERILLTAGGSAEPSVPYEEPDTRDLPTTGPSGGRVVGNARGQRERDPMLDRFLGLSRAGGE